MNRIELTDEEIHHLMVMLKVAGFREKREFHPESKPRRTEEMRIMGRILKKLRKAEHLT